MSAVVVAVAFVALAYFGLQLSVRSRPSRALTWGVTTAVILAVAVDIWRLDRIQEAHLRKAEAEQRSVFELRTKLDLELRRLRSSASLGDPRFGKRCEAVLKFAEAHHLESDALYEEVQEIEDQSIAFDRERKKREATPAPTTLAVVRH